MPYDPQIHHRRSIRLQGHDYSQAGLYFITICCKYREHIFGKIKDGKMILNDAGKIANDFFGNIPARYEQAGLHEFVVMPDHVHMIVEIKPGDAGAIHAGAIHAGAIHAGAIHESPLLANESPLPLRDQRRKMLLSKIIGWYKMNTAKQINIILNRNGTPLWQRDYYDKIIRDEASYKRISRYIADNPGKGDL